MKVDPIKFEVLRNGFLEATEEMALALRRSAYSTNIKTRCDFSCCLFDRDLRPIAQSFSQPNHLGSMVGTVRQGVLDYGVENLAPGDQLVVNYPYPSGAHLNDIVVVAPFLHEGEIHGYFGNLAHHVDVGGGAPASVGAFRELYQEGVVIPPVKMVREGEIVDDVFRLVLAQIRSKRETAGDFRAQFAANNTGVRRLTALFERYGPETVSFYMDELIAYTDRRTRAELASLPRGEYVAEGYVDNDGFSDRPVRLAVRVAVDADGVLFDFTGSDPQRRAPVNSTYAQTYSAAAYSLKCIADPDLPVNEGFYRHVRLVAPEGTVVNCVHPFPVVGGWETQVRLNDTIFKALAQAIPETDDRRDEGDAVSRGVRRRRSPLRGVLLLPGDAGRRLRRPGEQRRAGCGTDTRTEHRERAGRGDRDQLSGADPALRGSWRTPKAPAGSGAASACAATTASTTTR